MNTLTSQTKTPKTIRNYGLTLALFGLLSLALSSCGSNEDRQQSGDGVNTPSKVSKHPELSPDFQKEIADIQRLIQEQGDSYSSSTSNTGGTIIINDEVVRDTRANNIEVKANFKSIHCYYDGVTATIDGKVVQDGESRKGIMFDLQANRIFYRK